jgi:glycosyltransferase involved in cell wall biosynthesis
MNPLISIIVPVYKVEKYLEKCVNSLINQTYKEIEIILINDGSPDNCPEICDDFGIKFKNIQVIHQENLGLSAARNAGIDIAKGKYLTFVDSDDFVHSTFIEFLKSEMDTNGVLLSICGYEKTSNIIVDTKNVKSFATTLKINDSAAFEFLLENQELCTAWGKIYSASLFKDLRFPINKLYEDMFVMPLIFKKAMRISISFNKLYYYNQEGPSITRSSYNYSKISQYFEACEFWNNFASTNYPEHSEKASLHFFRNILNLCIEIRFDKKEDVRKLYKKYKVLVLNQIVQLLFSKNFPIRDKVKLVLLKINFY